MKRNHFTNFSFLQKCFCKKIVFDKKKMDGKEEKNILMKTFVDPIFIKQNSDVKKILKKNSCTKTILTEKVLSSLFCYVIDTVFDQNSPFDGLSESSGGGPRGQH